VPPKRQIEYRVGINVGDGVEESEGDLMGDLGQHRLGPKQRVVRFRPG
jgi:hypothetical protein